MSELRVDTINEATSGTGTTISKLTNPNQPFRNKIINGDFQIFQRGASAVTAPTSLTNYVSADRWLTQFSTDGAMTLEQSSLSLADKATTGVANALEIKCTTADTSIAAGQYALLLQSIEAQFLQDLGYGTSSAKTLTLSFYVKSNLTGTFCITVLKGDTTAAYLPIEYTINSADTWERKTITISPNAGSTSLITGSGGVINDDNGVGIQLIFNLALGSNFTGGTNNTWSTSTHFATSNQSNFLSSTSNNFHLTGVQLEVGETATDFEVLPNDVQLQRCQRYFQTYVDPPLRGVINATNSVGRAAMILPVEMAKTPAASVGNHGLFDGSSASFLNAVTTSYLNSKAVEFDMTCANSVMVVGRAGVIFNGGNATFTLDAEL